VRQLQDYRKSLTPVDAIFAEIRALREQPASPMTPCSSCVDAAGNALHTGAVGAVTEVADLNTNRGALATLRQSLTATTNACPACAIVRHTRTEVRDISHLAIKTDDLTVGRLAGLADKARGGPVDDQPIGPRPQTREPHRCQRHLRRDRPVIAAQETKNRNGPTTSHSAPTAAWSPTARWSAHSPTNRRRRGGLLGGEPSLVAIVREILAGSLPKRVRVAEPNLDYVFTDSRDTLADVAAAMLVAGNGRGRLSDAGWDALDAAMADDAGPDTGSPVIH
jgi:hypothetical protein